MATPKTIDSSLKQFMMDVICTGDGDVPLFLRIGDGNEFLQHYPNSCRLSRLRLALCKLASFKFAPVKLALLKLASTKIVS